MKFSIPVVSFVALFLSSCVGTPCTLKSEDSELRGFKLGMPLQDVQKKFSSFPTPIFEEYGRRSARIDYHQVPTLSDVQDAQIEFVDERITSIRIYYKNNVQWKNADEFTHRIGETLDVGQNWKKVGTDNDFSEIRYSECSNFSVSAGISKRLFDNLRLPFVEFKDFIADSKPLVREFQEQENINRQKEVEKQSFRP